MISKEQSEQNLAKLADPNRGRLVGIVRSRDGRRLRFYNANGGRSPESQNRIHDVTEDLNGNGPMIQTDLFDRTMPTEHAAANLYIAQRAWGSWHAASNGEQTGYIASHLATASDPLAGFMDGQLFFRHEGPKNLFTQRVQVAARRELAYAFMGAIRPHPSYDLDPHSPLEVPSVHEMYVLGVEYSFDPGEGYLTATYDGQGGTTPNYEDPWGVLLEDDLEASMEQVWKMWDLKSLTDPTIRKSKVNLAGKELDIDTGEITISLRSIHHEPKLLHFPPRVA